jgi:hypothetical protein
VLRNHLIELKYLNSLRRIREGTNYDPGWKKFGSGIWDKHPGSATMYLKIKIFSMAAKISS